MISDSVQVALVGGGFTILGILITRLTAKVDGQLKKQDEQQERILQLSVQIATELGMKQGVKDEKERDKSA